MNELESKWTEIVEDVGPDLYRFFMASFTAEKASDLVQETLIRLVQKQRNKEFDSEKGSLKNFAFGIAKYVRLESLKKKLDFQLVENDSDLDIPTSILIDRSDPITHLRWAIGQLKPIEQDLILQMIDEEATFEKIAIDFKMPVGTVKSHIHRAKEKLRQIMEVNHEK